MNHFNIPFLWPFKMVPCTSDPGIHFDDAWACEQIKSFEKYAVYRQKWKLTDTTLLQIESSIAPEDMKLLDRNGYEVKTFEWSAVFVAVNYTIWETTFDVSDVDPGRYFVYQRVQLMAIDWPTISECIDIKSSWPGTLLLTFSHSFNDYDIAWTTGIQMKFRVESAIMGFDPKRERTDYVNQNYDTSTLKAQPYREFVFEVGKAAGVAEWVTDILNRIFCCDSIDIQGLKYQAKSGAEGKISRVKGYPLVGWSQDIVPAVNKQSLQFADTSPLLPGVVTAYNLLTGFFGPGSTVPIIDID